MKSKECMLTTIDNPFNPFKDFEKWYQFDQEKGYKTCEYLARIVKTSNELSETDQDLAIDLAIDEILLFDFKNLYKKVYSD